MIHWITEWSNLKNRISSLLLWLIHSWLNDSEMNEPINSWRFPFWTRLHLVQIWILIWMKCSRKLGAGAVFFLHGQRVNSRSWDLRKRLGIPSGYLTVRHGKSPFLIGKPSISMGHLYHGYVSHNQRVTSSHSKGKTLANIWKLRTRFWLVSKWRGFRSHRATPKIQIIHL